MNAPIPAGPIVPLVTPFDADEAVSPPALQALVEHILAAEPAGLLSTALTGEGPLLTETETRQVWEITAATAGNLPVLAAIITTRTATAVALAGHAERLGLTAVMPAPILPELYAQRSTGDLIGFHAAIAARTDLPQILFNYPSLTGVDLTPDTIEPILARVPSVVAIKESSGDSRRVHALHRRFGDRLQVICGAPDTALESLALGATTWITGIMNAVPEAAAALMTAVRHGDLPAARDRYHRHILPVVDIMRATGNPTGTIKAALRLRGRPVGPPRAPGTPLTGPYLEELQKIVTSAGHQPRAVPSLRKSEAAR